MKTNPRCFVKNSKILAGIQNIFDVLPFSFHKNRRTVFQICLSLRCCQIQASNANLETPRNKSPSKIFLLKILFCVATKKGRNDTVLKIFQKLKRPVIHGRGVPLFSFTRQSFLIIMRWLFFFKTACHNKNIKRPPHTSVLIVWRDSLLGFGRYYTR